MVNPDLARSRTFVVTGVASGIGLATARRLVAEGGTVIGADLAAPPDDHLKIHTNRTIPGRCVRATFLLTTTLRHSTSRETSLAHTPASLEHARRFRVAWLFVASAQPRTTRTERTGDRLGGD